MKPSDKARQYAYDRYARPAIQANKTGFTVRAGDVHDGLGFANRMPLVCGALGANKMCDEYGLKRVRREGPQNGPNARFTFAIVKRELHAEGDKRMAYDYETLDITIEGAVLTATVNNPPINLMTIPLLRDLIHFTSEVEADEAIRAVIFQSADPDFFIAHFDVEALLKMPADAPAEKSPALSDFHLMCERVRTMPKATLVKMAGRAGGGGNEFAASCDMRFGLRGKTLINQMEVALGILPGGSGTQRLPRLVGRGRAMEICLGSDDMDAETAERWGYLNRIFDTAAALDDFVARLAQRIAAWSPEAIALCKASINNAEMPWQEGLLEEAFLFQQTLRTASAQGNMRKALELGMQTREGELRMGELCRELGEAAGGLTDS